VLTTNGTKLRYASFTTNSKVSSLTTDILLDCAIAPYTCSYFLITTLMDMKVDVVFPQNASLNSDFRKGQSLGKNDHIK
jgi:hypothetical protein